jgi:hypothetical protein
LPLDPADQPFDGSAALSPSPSASPRVGDQATGSNPHDRGISEGADESYQDVRYGDRRVRVVQHDLQRLLRMVESRGDEVRPVGWTSKVAA